MSSNRFNLRWLRRRQHHRMRPKAHAPASMIGRLAKTVTPLRSAGIVEIDDRHVEVFSTCGFIPPGTIVRIVGKMTSWYTVEPLSFGSLNPDQV